MPRNSGAPCCGTQGTCSCLLEGGDGIIVSGSGSPSDPYVISAQYPDFSQSFQVRDTESVNMTLIGSGIPGDPFVLSAESSLALTQLSDVDDPQGGPAVGDVPVWVGAGDAGHWEFQPPPPNPAGAVNVADGLVGNGTAGTPIKVKMIGTSSGGATTGLEVYQDAAGNLRAVPPPISNPTWASITGKPTTFPSSPHTHVAADITDPQNLLVGGFNAAQAAGGTGVVGPFPVYVGTTENTGWPNGTIWLQPQL